MISLAISLRCRVSRLSRRGRLGRRARRPARLRVARRLAGAARPSTSRGVARRIPVVRRQAPPLLGRGADRARRAPAHQPAGRPLQRGLGPLGGAGRRRGPRPRRAAGPPDLRDRRRAVRRRLRAPAARRGRVGRRRRRDLPALELAPGRPHAPLRRDHRAPISSSTRCAVFSDADLAAAMDDLVALLRAGWPGAEVSSTVIT